MLHISSTVATMIPAKPRAETMKPIVWHIVTDMVESCCRFQLAVSTAASVASVLLESHSEGQL